MVPLKGIFLFDVDSNKLFAFRKSQALPYAELNFDNSVTLEKVQSVADSSDTGYVLDFGIKNRDNSKKYL